MKKFLALSLSDVVFILPKAERRFVKDTGPTYVMIKMIGLRLMLCL